VKYNKRTHRQIDFDVVKEGELTIRQTQNIEKVTYVLRWTLRDEDNYARVSKPGLEMFTNV